MVMPGKTVVLDGALGPLMFSGAAGHLVWTLTEASGKTTLTQTYYVGGYYPRRRSTSWPARSTA